MKRPKFIFYLLFLVTGKIFSQPIVNVNDFPKPGTVLKYYMGNSLAPVNNYSGREQTWDFSSFELSPVNDVVYLQPEKTNGFSDFPISTIAFEAPVGSGDYTFLDLTENHYKYLGFLVNSNEVPVLGKYDDSWIVYSLPLHFNDELKDDFSSTSTVIFKGDTVKTFFRSEYSYKVDGFGKLITPYRTYPNTLRVTAKIHGVDSAIHKGSVDTTIVTTYTTEKTSWLSSGNGGVFEQVSTFNFTDFFFQDVVKATSAKNVFVKKESLNLYPDPATDFVNLELSGISTGPLTIKVYSSFGEVMLYYNYTSFGMDFIKKQIPTSGFAPGLYYVKVYSHNNEWVSKFVKQ